LQASIERHVTRTVDSVLVATENKRHIELNAKLLIAHTCEKMRIIQGKKTFKRFALTDLSCRQFEEIFWLVFSKIFQKVNCIFVLEYRFSADKYGFKSAEEEERKIMESICSQYVKTLSFLRTNKDLIFRIYPYAISSAVCSGFHYLFPGSRHLYTNDFKNEVSKLNSYFVYELILIQDKSKGFCRRV